MRFVLAASWLALLLSAPGAQAQNIEVDPTGEYFVLQFDEVNGEKLEDFIDLAQKILQRPIKYSRAELGDTRIQIIGPQKVAIDDFYKYFQAVLKAYDFIVVNYGPQGSDFLSVQKLGGAGPRGGVGGIKPNAVVIDVSEIAFYKDDPGVLLTTSVPLKYVDARTANTTFATMFDQQIEQVRAVENSNSIVFTAFGTTLWGAYQLVQLIDVPPFKPQPVIRKRILAHASVDEIEQVLNDLLSAARGLRPGQVQAAAQGGAAQLNEIEPRIIAEPRSNSFLIAGDLENVDRIEAWIDVLDVEVAPRGNIHIYRLKNMRAADLVEVLQQVLEEERQAAQASNRGQGGAQAASVTSTSGLEIQASVVADSQSNSLVITASDRKYAEIVEIIRDLDVRRPQVLVEAAIVETGQTLNESLEVGIAFGDFDDGAVISNFGGVPTGFDSETGMVDIPGAAGGAAGAGGSFAIFSGSDLPIPLIIQAIATDSAAKVLSRPSLLTNDNQEAIISTEEETAYETSTILASGNESRSFETVTAGIELRVSPTISAGNYLRLRVRIEVSNFEDSRSGVPGAPPDILRREIETPVTVPDGHTVILGGLVAKASGQSESKVPWLGDLPVIGWMFRSKSSTSQDRYLYVFITPHIIDTDFALLDEISAARRYDYDRLGGDIADLAAGFGQAGIDADMRQIGPTIQYVFDMPTSAFPVGGGGVAPTTSVVPTMPPPLEAPPPLADPGTPQPVQPGPLVPEAVPQPAPQADPGFDDVFGFGGGGSGN